MSYLVEPIKAFQESNRTNIAIFCPFTSTDTSLYQDLIRVCSNAGTAEMVNEVFLNSFEAMNRGIVDILIIPELELVQKKMYYQIKKYIEAGGAVIIACDDYFMTGKILDDQFSQFDVEAVGGDAYYRSTSGFLGIKPYVSDIAPVMAKTDSNWIPDAEPLSMPLPANGAQINVGSDRISPQPPDGHVFIERYEVLRNYDAVIGCDHYGNKLNTQVNFAQNWENGARFVLYSSNNENSLIRKSNPLFETVLTAAISFCENKVFAVSCAPEFACYRSGEPVTVSYELQNGSTQEQSVEIKAEIRDCNGTLVFQQTDSVLLSGHSKKKGTVLWNPDDFSCDSYSICVSVFQNQRLLSKAENGFVVWNEAVVQNGPSISIDGKYFSIAGNSSMITGTNYYESNIGEVMWIKPNIKKLESDFRQMSADGINFIRIHYHHAKWFQDYLKHCTGQMLEYYQGLEDDYLPSERILRIFDAHIYLAQKYGIVYGGDLFTLLPEELGDPKGWYGVQDYAWFTDKLTAQKEFLDLLIPRYTHVPGIAWDLYNEPCCVFCDKYIPAFNEAFYSWASEIKQYMRQLGDRHLITVGAEKPERFGDIIEFFAEHVNYKYIPERKATTDLPEVIQECWLDRPATPLGEQQQLQDIREALLHVVGLGFAGFLPWQWTNQQRLWCDWRTFAGEIWDDRLGACVRNDGTLKPAGRFYRDFIRLIHPLHFIRYEESAIVTDQGQLSVGQDEDGQTMLLCQDGQIVRGMAQKKLEGKTLSLHSESRADLFYLHAPEADYVKANQAVLLALETNRIPAQIEVCDKPGGVVIAQKEAPSSRTFSIPLLESDINYWLKLSYPSK